MRRAVMPDRCSPAATGTSQRPLARAIKAAGQRDDCCVSEERSGQGCAESPGNERCGLFSVRRAAPVVVFSRGEGLRAATDLEQLNGAEQRTAKESRAEQRRL